MKTTHLSLLTLLAACASGAADDVDTDLVVDSEPPGSDSDPVDTDPVDSDPVDTDPVDVDDTDTGASTALPVVTCPSVVSAPTSGLCDATAGAGDALLLTGRVLAPDAVYAHGQVLIDADGRIACVGCGCDAEPAAADADRVACRDGVLSPGLIDAHTHLTFAEEGPLPATSTRYDHRHDWRSELPTSANPGGTTAASAGMRWVELRHLLAGTTSVVGNGAATGLVRNLERAGAQLADDLPLVATETFPLGDADRVARSGCAWNYDRDERQIAAEDAWIGHVGVGVDDRAVEEVRCLSTSFDGGQDLAGGNTAWTDGLGLTALTVEELARNGTSLVWSPRSNLALYGATAPVGPAHRAGVNVALGTDWAYTGSASLLRELACAAAYDDAYLDDALDDVDLWRMATTNGAAAAGAEGRLGALVVGAYGDVVVFDGRTRADHAAVVHAGDVDVRLVVRGGDLLLAEPETVSELGTTGCEPLDVCQEARAVCLGLDVGVAAIAAAVPSAYPAAICGVPADEPTCVPSRPGAYDGVPTATDGDGDGVDDADDLCPRVFDPVLPLHHGAQADADADGRGDACDPSPLLPDVDGDGVSNPDDSCWLEPDATQADADNDLIGDVCDACPSTPNPGTVCPAP